MENVADRKAFSGGRYHAWLVVRALADLGHKVTVMTGRIPFFVSQLPGTDHTAVLDRRPMLNAGNCHLKRTDGRFDLVCVFPLRAIPWGVKLAKSIGKPVFTWVFDPFTMVNQYAPDIAGRMSFGGGYLPALRDSDVIVSSTDVSRQYILAYAGSHLDVQTLYPCANSTVADEAGLAFKPDSTLRIMTITRGTNHKHPEHVFRAFRELIRAGVDAHLHVLSGFGDGRLKRLSKRYHVSRFCTFEAKCTEKRKWQLMRSMDLMLGASTYEGFGLWLMEAIYACMPFVVYDFPLFKEISCGYGGWFAAYNNVGSLGAALITAAREDRRSKIQHLSSIAPTFCFREFRLRVARLIK
jgi:glycosyltransferase involved in cell wall biosynthesis